MRAFFSLSFALVWGQVLFGGQSIRTSTEYAYNNSFPARAHNLPARVEFELHDWAVNPTVNSIAEAANAVGFNAYFQNSGGTAQLYLSNSFDSGGAGSTCIGSLAGLPTQTVYVRYQRDPSINTNYCEFWDSNGKRFFNTSWTYVSDNAAYAFSGAGGGSGQNRGVAFFRIYSDLIPQNSRMPATADGGATRLLEWKFDGNLNDASGHGWTAVMSNAPIAPTYVATPDQKTISVIKTQSTFWSNWTSLRAGFPATLDGTGSLSEGDSTPTVTCFWAALSGPTAAALTALQWSSRTSCSPTVTGLIFGTYNFALVAIDAPDNLSATSSLQVGAVATDNNGVVVQANPAADTIFGPMIAWGKNPWAWQDQRAYTATTLRSAYYDSIGLSTASWNFNQPGTISYDWFIWPKHTTTLATTITSSSTSITVSDITKIDTSDFPTFIRVGSVDQFEEIKICSCAGAVCQVCYDGRGQHTPGGNGNLLAASSHTSGDSIIQSKITGTGTTFSSTVCAAGLGWNAPPALYSTGTITLTAGSTTATGASTAWLTPVSYQTKAVRVLATHASGTPFVFFAYISGVGSNTSMTLARPYPSDADSGTFSYSIIFPDQRNIVVHYQRADTTDGSIFLRTSECGSDLSVYYTYYWDIGRLNNTTIYTTNRFYSYMDGVGYANDFGVNFYDEGLAHYSLYLRSGWQPALDAFRKLEGQDGTTNKGWLFYPEMNQGDTNTNTGPGRHASLLGATAAAVLDGKSSNWSAIRSFANTGAANTVADCNYDTRELAYYFSWIAMAAVWDPNGNSAWLTPLTNAYNRDNGCKGSGSPLLTNSFVAGNIFSTVNPISFYGGSWHGSVGPLTMTNGSTAVTGTGINAGLCYSAGPPATGLTVTAGSDVVTGTGFVNGTHPFCPTCQKIAIDQGGTYYAFEYIVDSPTQIHLSAMWPGTSASGLTGFMDNDEYGLTFGTDTGDLQIRKAWSCTWNSATSITLDRPWDAGLGVQTTVYGFRGNIVGAGQQPFILGVKVRQMDLASNVASSPLNTNYAALATGAANWINTYGRDPLTQGMYYYRIWGNCEPIYAPSSQPNLFPEYQPICNQPRQEGRTLSAEAQNAYRLVYASNPTPTVRCQGDQFYGAQWGALGGYTQTPTSLTNCTTDGTTPGYWADGVTASQLDDGSLGGPKYPGFFFGFGASHQWPAVRLGGVQPAVNRNVAVGFNLSSVPGATSVQIVLTSPSGKVATVSCPGSPCIVTADARQGMHLMSLVYKNGSGKIIAQSDQNLPVAVQ